MSADMQALLMLTALGVGGLALAYAGWLYVKQALSRFIRPEMKKGKRHMITQQKLQRASGLMSSAWGLVNSGLDRLGEYVNSLDELQEADHPRRVEQPTSELDHLLTADWGSVPGMVEQPQETLQQALKKLPRVVSAAALLDKQPSPLHVPVGITSEGETLWQDTSQAFLAVYGLTGSGKDNAMRVWFTYLTRSNTPEQVRFILIDGKTSWSLAAFNGKAHLFADPFCDDKIQAGLDAALGELERRVKLSRAANVEGLAALRKAYPNESLPLLIVLLSDVGSDLEKEVEATLARIIQKGRAVGVRAWVSFQNPSNKATSWRSNISVKLVGRLDGGSQDEPATGRKSSELRFRPSQLPDPQQARTTAEAQRLAGVFVGVGFTRDGSDVLVKAPYISDDDFLGELCKRPKRQSDGDVLDELLGDTSIGGLQAPKAVSNTTRAIPVSGGIPDRDATNGDTTSIEAVLASIGRMSAEERIRLLVGLDRFASGSEGISANSIVNVAGANRNDVLKRVAELRKKD